MEGLRLIDERYNHDQDETSLKSIMWLEMNNFVPLFGSSINLALSKLKLQVSDKSSTIWTLKKVTNKEGGPNQLKAQEILIKKDNEILGFGMKVDISIGSSWSNSAVHGGSKTKVSGLPTSGVMVIIEEEDEVSSEEFDLSNL